MGMYEVTVRGGRQVDESEPEPVVDAVRSLGPRTLEASSSAAAALRAVEEVSPDIAVLLVEVRDEQGRPTLYWPSGDPVTYSRKHSVGTGEGYCFAQVAGVDCLVRGAPERETAVFADDAEAFGWVCDACAVVVAPGL
jgi:hypothetical protein